MGGGALPLVQKGQTPRSGYAVHSGHTVRSRCWCRKVNWHSGLSKYGWWGPLPLVQKGPTPHTVGAQYAVVMQCAVGVSAKRSTGTVDLANMGGGNRYL